MFDDEILVSELQDWMITKKKINLIDIREEYERDDYRLNDTHFIPMDQIMSSMDKLNKEISTVIYCQTGNKSKAVAAMMRKQGFSYVYSLAGGVHQWVANELSS